MSTQKFCQASANNQDAILSVLRKSFSTTCKVLEIGSGTGQHAVYFAKSLAHLTWQPSDVIDNHDSIIAWQKDAALDNLNAPLTYKVGCDAWPPGDYDGAFSANTSHIMQPEEVRIMMAEVATHLVDKGVFCLYGPFTQNGKHKGESNLRFDMHLREQGYGGYRDITELQKWAGENLTLKEIIDMPANNHILEWHKK